MAIKDSSATGFDENVRALWKIVDCRPAVLTSEKERVYRLRYSAYLREGALPPGAPELFKDKFDDVDNGLTFGLYIDGRLSSSIRIHVASFESPECPAMSVFSDYLLPMIEQGFVVLDPTRFVIDADAARRFPKLPYATLRVCWMASDYFQADYVLASVRTEHQSFYRRIFGHHVVCPARPYPSLSKPISLMILDFRRERERILDRYRFFEYANGESHRLFRSLSVGTRHKSHGGLGAPVDSKQEAKVSEL